MKTVYYANIVLITFLLTNCTNGESNFERILTKNESCWIFYNYPDEQGENVIIASCNKFYANGSFDGLIVSEGKLRKRLYPDKNVKQDDGWNFNENDSVFDVGGEKFMIIKYSNDTIVMRNENDHVQKLVRMNVSEFPANERKNDH
jgi:hypothetical protein